MSEMNQIEDEMFFTDGAGSRQVKRHHMEFKYPDADIHNDLYQLVKFSCGDCTLEQQEKVMKIWTTFLEPFFGVPPHLPDTEEQEDLVKADVCVTSSAQKICKDSSPAADDAVCKTLNIIKSGNEFISTDHSCYGRLLMSGNFGVNNDCSCETHIVRSKSDVQFNAPQTRLLQPDTGILSAESLFSKPTGFMDKFCPNNNAGEKSAKENASVKCKGPDDCSANFGIEAIAGQEPQVGVFTKHMVRSSTSITEDVKVPKQHAVSEVCIKGALEDGELSRNRNVEEGKFSPSGNTYTKGDQIPCKNAPQTTSDGGDKICIEEAGQETNNTNTNGEGEESTRGSSESENASENGDVSSSDSPNVEECSPDDDGDHDENANKAKIHAEADCMVDVHDIDGTMSYSSRFLGTAKPLTVKVPMTLYSREKNSQIFYGNDSFYMLFRQHHLLFERMQSAKIHSSSPESKWKTLKAANPTDSYARFKDALRSLLSGSSDNAKFEDECRSIIGAQSYILFTLDKLIHKLIKQLQTDEMDNKLLQLYAYERSRSHGTFSDAVYYQNARFLLPDDNLYRIEYLQCTTKWNNESSLQFPCPTNLTVQLMKNEQEKPEPMAVSMDPRFEAYLKNEILSDVPERRARPGVFMKRNMRKFSTGDTVRAMEGLAIQNCMEMKVNCSTLKVSYVLETEDFLYRRNTRKRSSNVLCGGISNGCPRKGKRRKLMSIFKAMHQNGGSFPNG